MTMNCDQDQTGAAGAGAGAGAGRAGGGGLSNVFLRFLRVHYSDDKELLHGPSLSDSATDRDVRRSDPESVRVVSLPATHMEGKER